MASRPGHKGLKKIAEGAEAPPATPADTVSVKVLQPMNLGRDYHKAGDVVSLPADMATKLISLKIVAAA